ncbi:MAG: hypothetical protein KAW52_00430 [candidate division Zixibacteria bacterium]|nr:hypothetical protein [candidate division Zixibacteria bacterium]
MEKIHWFDQDKNDEWKGHVFPSFRIYRTMPHNRLVLFIMDDRPRHIAIKSVQQGKIKAAKYLKKKVFEEFGDG